MPRRGRPSMSDTSKRYSRRLRDQKRYQLSLEEVAQPESDFSKFLHN